MDNCFYGMNCNNYYCKYNHPETRLLLCPLGSACKYKYELYDIDGKICNHSLMCLHPQKMLNCKFKDKCKNYDCKYNHPDTRAPLCLDGFKCMYIDPSKITYDNSKFRETVYHFLSYIHSKEIVCKFNFHRNFEYCTRLHLPPLCRHGLTCNLIKNTSHLKRVFHLDEWLINNRKQCEKGEKCIYYLSRKNKNPDVVKLVQEHCVEFYH